MNRIALTLALLLCAISVRADQTVKTPTTYVPPASLTIQSGVPLSGTWDFSTATVLGLPGGKPGGSDTQFQYNNAGVFAGTAALVDNAGEIDATTLLWRFVDETDPTKKISFDLTNLLSPSDIAVTVSGAGSPVIPSASAVTLNQFVTGLSPLGVITTARPTISNLANLSSNGKLVGSGGSSPIVTEIALGPNFVMNAGTLKLVIGGTNGQTQWNNQGVLGGVTSQTTDGTVVTQLAGTNFLLADPTTQTKKVQFNLSNIAAATTEIVTVAPGLAPVIPNANPAVAGLYMTGISNTGLITVARTNLPIVLPITSSATPAINTDQIDAVTITALATPITSMTTSLTGTPNNFQRLLIRIKDNGTAQAIAWGASFVSSQATLPTTTVANKVTTIGLIWDAVKAKWVCMATDQEP